MLIFYLSGATDQTHEKSCREQIKGERYTIRKLVGAEKQQIMFSDLIVLYFFSLIEHELSMDIVERTKVYNKPH